MTIQTAARTGAVDKYVKKFLLIKTLQQAWTNAVSNEETR